MVCSCVIYTTHCKVQSHTTVNLYKNIQEKFLMSYPSQMKYSFIWLLLKFQSIQNSASLANVGKFYVCKCQLAQLRFGGQTHTDATLCTRAIWCVAQCPPEQEVLLNLTCTYSQGLFVNYMVCSSLENFFVE